MSTSFVSGPISIPAEARTGRFARADIVVEGLEQAGPSFEGHLFLNNAAADRHTERNGATGYAGAFHVYGQGVPRPEADGGGAAVAPITKHVTATDAVRAAISDADQLTVTIVPIVRSAGEPAPLRTRVSLVFA